MSEWEMVRLGDVVAIKTGKLDANASSDDGEYPFFTCSREPLKISGYSYDCECVLVAGNGDLNVKYYKGKFDAYQRTYIIEAVEKDSLYVPFLYLFLDNYLVTLREQSIGGVIKYIKLGNLTEAKILLPPLAKQQEIAHQLDEITELISLRKVQIKKLDLLVKAKFSELVSTKATDYNIWEEVKVGELGANSKGSMRTGPFGSALLHSEFEEKGIFVLGIDNAVQNKFSYNKMRYISEEKYQELKRYTVFPRDIIITIMGTVGRVAVVPDDIPLAINTKHLACLTLNEKLANPHFIAFCFRSHPLVLEQIEKSKKGSIMDGMNLTLIKAIKIPLPPLPLQEQFAHYVQTVEEAKKEMEEGLAKMELLYQERMQRWFG